ncbi:MAG: hypothetical protein JJU29_07165 [Verrucomicrobia bacterium]|nr:hypothetical protein [Verrucomicrobiota bacterium]MCH8510797.1 hypothetical protein [Kiritimatiellia bacterium]
MDDHEIPIDGTLDLHKGVHRLLEKLPQVAKTQHPCPAHLGDWGATLVRLHAEEKGQ